MSSFSFTKLENRMAEQEFDTSGRGEEVRNMCRRVNMVQILYTHVCKQKKIFYALKWLVTCHLPQIRMFQSKKIARSVINYNIWVLSE
jgi:hypothetical protein